MRIVAIIAAYNEADILRFVVQDLLDNGVEVYIIDNESTDGTLASVLRPLMNVRFEVMRTEGFQLREILKRKIEIANSYPEGTWIINADADEFRSSPWLGLTLREAIERVDEEGFNAINFEVITYAHPQASNGGDPRIECIEPLREKKAGDQLQIRAWKHRPGVDLASSGGHEARFEGRKVYPMNFIMHHYPTRSDAHAKRKIEQERLPRFDKEERAMGWHVQYDTRIDVVLIPHQIQTRPYGHECFQEIAYTLQSALKDKGFLSDIRLCNREKSARCIVLGWHLATDDTYDENCIIYNMEQLQGWNEAHHGCEHLIERLAKLSKRCTIWDYSHQNITMLNEAGVHAKLVSIGYAPCLERIESADVQDIDILFYGTLNKRRVQIIQKLLAAGLNITCIQAKYGDDRDAYISRAKIVLNLHYYENASFEMARVSYLLANGKCVVSEKSADMGLLPIYCEGDLAAGLKWLLKEMHARKSIEVSAREWMRTQPQQLPEIPEMFKPYHPKICLTMIAKNEKESNEEHVIERCLNSCAGLISDLVVVGNGRLGNGKGTVLSIAEEWARKHGVKFDLMHLVWNGNFDEMRNYSLDAAQDTDCEWLLMLDCDEWMHTKPEEIFEALATARENAVVVPMILANGRLNPRLTLVRNMPGWSWKFAHHETLLFNGEPAKAQMIGDMSNVANGPHIGTAQDGARSQDPDKLAHDIEKLKALVVETKDPRYVFFLAETMRGAPGAVALFEEYIASEPPQVGMKYYALLAVARIYAETGDPQTALAKFLTAYNICPSRVEALGEIALLYAQCKAWAMSKVYALSCAHAPIPDPRCIEFLEPEWAVWKGLALLAEALEGLNQFGVAKQYWELLMTREGVPDPVREKVTTKLEILR